jgi:hypothetical protein
VYDQPSYGQPGPGQAAPRQNGRGRHSAGRSPQGEPGYGQAAPGQPASGQPGFSQPGFSQPGPGQDWAGGAAAARPARGRHGGGGGGPREPGYGPSGGPAAGTEPSYYNLAYGTRGYDAPGQDAPRPDVPRRGSHGQPGNGYGPEVYGAPVAEMPVREAPRHRAPRHDQPPPGPPRQPGRPAPEYGAPAREAPRPAAPVGEPGYREPRYGAPPRGGYPEARLAEPPPAPPARAPQVPSRPPPVQDRPLQDRPRRPQARVSQAAPPETSVIPSVAAPAPRSGQTADTHAYGLNVPPQPGPVSAPFTAPGRRSPGRDEPATSPRDRRPVRGQDGYDQPEWPGHSRDAGTERFTAAPELDQPGRAGSRRPHAEARPRSGGRRTQAAGRPARRRWIKLGHRGLLWTVAGAVALVGVVVVALSLTGSGPTGPGHTLTTPGKLGAFERSSQLTKQMDVAQLEKNIIAQSSGQASHLVSAVYQAGSPASGGAPAQVMLFIGGRLTGAVPADSVKSFTQHFKDATTTSAGSLGGDAACVAGKSGGTGGSTVCAWFDNNTFGELVSPNMSVTALANELRTIRPSVEHVIK